MQTTTHRTALSTIGLGTRIHPTTTPIRFTHRDLTSTGEHEAPAVLTLVALPAGEMSPCSALRRELPCAVDRAGRLYDLDGAPCPATVERRIREAGIAPASSAPPEVLDTIEETFTCGAHWIGHEVERVA